MAQTNLRVVSVYPIVFHYRNFQKTISDGKNYDIQHYNLSAMKAVVYKVNFEKGVQIRKSATQIMQEFTIKGFAMADERLKNLVAEIIGKNY